MEQARGTLSRGLSSVNLDVRSDVFVDVDSVPDWPVVINV